MQIPAKSARPLTDVCFRKAAFSSCSPRPSPAAFHRPPAQPRRTLTSGIGSTALSHLPRPLPSPPALGLASISCSWSQSHFPLLATVSLPSPVTCRRRLVNANTPAQAVCGRKALRDRGYWLNTRSGVVIGKMGQSWRRGDDAAKEAINGAAKEKRNRGERRGVCEGGAVKPLVWVWVKHTGQAHGSGIHAGQSYTPDTSLGWRRLVAHRAKTTRHSQLVVDHSVCIISTCHASLPHASHSQGFRTQPLSNTGATTPFKFANITVPTASSQPLLHSLPLTTRPPVHAGLSRALFCGLRCSAANLPVTDRNTRGFFC
ncbi:hypothetical protein BJ138DRAFT_1116976 [Hygrophoropsis aurantiaca]|uniref:Uncharacterized protein n=1 Tax=Hygrophoropsis aurantiaca TaxID=72124 RepID=A0ACB8A171_9AGAM|nr:hypothetical protein BJ138DRAFT_1116976 [Hygrophoropsis aurantiaca]